jgi:hypothetical protein
MSAAHLDTSDPVTFVRAMVGCAPAHFIETRIIRGDEVRRGHFAPNDHALIDHLREANRPRCNIYFGVAPRTTAGKGDRQHCAGLNCLYCDIDFKLTPEDIARDVLRNFCLPPSAIVETGGGIHGYWLLSDFLKFPEHFEQARSLLRRLCITLGADIAAAEPVRILRFPGTSNFKYDPPRPVRIAAFNLALKYAVADFEDLLCNVEDARIKRGVEWKETSPRDSDSTRPGDLFNARASWSALLEAHGWRLAHTYGGAGYWTRPGKLSGISASTNYDGHGILWVFTSSAPPLEAGRGYSKFSAFAHLEHHGDFNAAARELAEIRW